MDDLIELSFWLGGFILLALLGAFAGSTEEMKERAFILAGLTIVGGIARLVYRGYKQGQKIQPVVESNPQHTIGPQRTAISERISWLNKDFLVAVLFFSVWIGLTASISDSHSDRLTLAYLVCGQQERCAQRSATDMWKQLDIVSGLSCIAVVCTMALAAFRDFRLISLSGKLRVGKAKLPERFHPKLRFNSKRIFVAVCFLQMCFLISAIRRNVENGSPTPLISRQLESPQQLNGSSLQNAVNQPPLAPMLDSAQASQLIRPRLHRSTVRPTRRMNMLRSPRA